MNHKSKAVLFYLFQCVTVPFTMVAVRYATEGNNIFTMLMLQNIFSFFLILPFILRKGFSSLKSTKQRMLFARTLVGFFGVLMLFYGVTKVPLNEATSIGFTNPIFTTIMAVIILKEKLYNYKILGLFIGFLGVLITLRPDLGNFNHNVIYIIGGVFFLSVVQVLIRILNRTETPMTLLFYMIFYSAIINIPFGVYYWEMPKPENWVWIGVVGIMAFVNIYPLIMALKYSDISNLMPLDFSKLIFTAIFAWLFFGEMLNLWTVIGSVVILSGVYYVIMKERVINV